MKKNLLPQGVGIFVLILFCSCKVFQVSDLKNVKNTPGIGVEWSFGDRINPKLQPKIDSVIRLTMDQFNQEGHAFTLHPKQKKDKDYISFEVRKAKKVGTGAKAAGYTITTVGLIALPATMIATGVGAVAAFAYWPSHKVESYGELSPSLSAERKSFGYVSAETGALFTSDKKQLNKLLVRYQKALHKTFVVVEKQLVANQ